MKEVVWEVFIASAWDKDGLSTHHWYLLKDGRRVKRWTTQGYESNRKKAIEETMVRALRYIEKKGIVGAIFYTSDRELCISMNQAVDNPATQSTNMKFITSKMYQYECEFILVRENDKRIELAYHYANQLMETIKRRKGVSV